MVVFLQNHQNDDSLYLWKQFDDTKRVIIIRISKKNREYNGQTKKYKRTSNDQTTIYSKIWKLL
jgi:hypothetical protein